MKKTRKVVAVVAIRDDGKFVILRRSLKKRVHSGMWNAPSGGVKANESLENAAKREMFEETGLKISDIKVGSKEIVNADDFDLEINYLLARSNSDKVTMNEENVEYKWVTPKESLDYKFAVPKKVVKRVLKEFKLL